MSTRPAAERARYLDDALRLEHRAEGLRDRREPFLAGMTWMDAADAYRQGGNRAWARVLLERAQTAFIDARTGAVQANDTDAAVAAHKAGLVAYAKWGRLAGLEPASALDEAA